MKSEKVWDIFVRTFHWTLVGSMIGLYLSGDDFESVHTILGYFVICLVLLRIIWGFIGTKHARFHDFLYRPGKIYHYLKSLINGNPTHYIGHNPAGGLMVIVMLLSLLVTAFTGLKALGSEGKGPLTNAGISIFRFAYADEDEDDHDDDDQKHETGHHQKRQKEEFPPHLGLLVNRCSCLSETGELLEGERDVQQEDSLWGEIRRKEPRDR